MTYAGEDHWIRLALREFPKTKHLILICSRETKILNKEGDAIQIEIDYLKSAQNLLDDLAKDESGLPANKRRRYHLITPPNTRDHHELIRYFRGLIAHITKNNKKISINTTSGLQVWKLALYQVALEQRGNIDKFYLIIKNTGEIKNIRLYRQLKEYETDVMNIIHEKPDITIGELQETYHDKYRKGNMSFISRIIKILISEDLVQGKNVGREVRLTLTDDGSSYIPSSEYNKDFEKLFSERNGEVTGEWKS